MKLGKLAGITLALNLSVVSLAIIAWLGSSAQKGITTFSLAGLLAILAFSLMWVHYLSGAIKDTWFPTESTGVQYYITRFFVLFAIVIHPLLLTTYFALNHYGWPPGSYEAFFGSPRHLFVYLGWIALAAFLAFEINHQYQKKHWSRYIFHANILAMFLVLIHGFRLGTVTTYDWYYAVWWIYAIVFVPLALRLYSAYYKNLPSRWLGSIAIIAVLSVLVALTGLQVQPKSVDQKSTTTSSPATEAIQNKQTDQSAIAQQKQITMAELEKNSGVNGSLCWLAIDGVVYEVTDNPEWQNGQHIPSRGLASCGHDLTDVISQSPHGKSVLGQLRVIGQLK